MLIAICDDEQRELEAIEAALTAAAVELSADIEIAAYSSGAALIEAVESGSQPALAVWDIYMGEENGMKTAGVLRGLIPGLPCAFLTTSRDFAVEAFSLDALHYIMKPVTVEKLKELLERFFTHVERPPRCLTLSDQQGERQVPPLFVEPGQRHRDLFANRAEVVPLLVPSGGGAVSGRSRLCADFPKLHRQSE